MTYPTPALTPISNNNNQNESLISLMQRHIIQDKYDNGYKQSTFEGKSQQMLTVMDQIDHLGFVPENLIELEVNWFYNSLSFDESFFANESVDNIVSYIHTLYAAKLSSYAKSTDESAPLDIHFARELSDHAIYIDTSVPGVSNIEGPNYENSIDKKYLNQKDADGNVFRVESFRSGIVTKPSKPEANSESLRCYFVYKCNFVNPAPHKDETDLKVISDKNFYERSTENTKAIYSDIIKKVVERTGPVIELYEVDGSQERRIIIGFRQGTAPGYISALSDLYHYYGLTSSRKYVEQFSNGVSVVSLYLNQVTAGANGASPFAIRDSIQQVIREASLLYCLPNTTFQEHFATGDLSLQECIYAHSVFVFIQHFLNRLGPEYTSLNKFLSPTNPEHVEVLEKLKQRLKGETFSADYVKNIINDQIDLIRLLYVQFADVHYAKPTGMESIPTTLSYQRLQGEEVLTPEQMKHLIEKSATNDHQSLVMKAFLTFNENVLKTNFYTPTKIALSFRFRPSTSFLPVTEFPTPLYGMFLVVGQEFHGFHLRFRDVARGGIRIVKSRSVEAYGKNLKSLFIENYNLANTQQRKNKDIPEGGSKGVILLDPRYQDRANLSFQKYIDSILDLLLPGATPGIKEPIVDLYNQPEIVFMGPDENTAGLVNWATLHAKSRGAPWWKSFFTGKDAALGGIPHDHYGMTSLSVREYIEGIYQTNGIKDQSTVRKLQTGGPDGDLGSNEILLSGETYVAIVDGSGVLHDPKGLDRNELVRLATERLMINNYSSAKLSSEGYKILVDDKDLVLPSGECVSNGTNFRNSFHLRNDLDVDVFVPCGGRPEAINITNVNKLINPKTGKVCIKWIVEGANLFITQPAKIRLEEAGCILYKDASTNKGGVTSSSLEVLASLAFKDDDFYTHMCQNKESKVLPEFYQAYVLQVQQTIKNNAKLEFFALDALAKLTGEKRSILSDTVSIAINDLSDELQLCSLWEDAKFRTYILNNALPSILIDRVGGLDAIVGNVPDSYLRAIFGSWLAGRFVYERATKIKVDPKLNKEISIGGSGVEFFEWIRNLESKE
ncbi:putative NAD-specific glutamate dehydrogenase [Nadsonia fulvescens var. elongata DSM 6958]|uniref:NAD-specific glutamate dehydrogenase n=1 Tax=Nadsonia fulvescens var. elongata DSM 6958 TaxID=857566 RepID=A0A1E3PL12_9ASCO|nr:putative NAD-specific glutamate dehydrogenase [Nadsonia fulvescens var. elongata DSM 6958]